MIDLRDDENATGRFNRRELLVAIAATLPAVTLRKAEAGSAESSAQPPPGISAQSTYFLPSVLRNNKRRGAAWSDSITVQNGELVRAVPVYKTL